MSYIVKVLLADNQEKGFVYVGTYHRNSKESAEKFAEEIRNTKPVAIIEERE